MSTNSQGHLRKDTSLQTDNVVFRQQVDGVRNVTSEACLVHPLSDFLLDFVDRVLKALRDGVAAQRLDVEAVRGRRKDQESHDLVKKKKIDF